MAEPIDVQKSAADEEWSFILGQTNAFLGHVQNLAQREPNQIESSEPQALEEQAPLPTEEDETAFVAVFPRSTQRIAVSFQVEGRAISRARALYQELTGFRLRVMSISSAHPEIVFDEPIALPGKTELELSLPQRASFVMVAVGVLDAKGVFRPLAHAPPVALSPAVSYPKEHAPPIFIDLQTAATVAVAATPLPPSKDEDPSEINSSWYIAPS
jgi:hypothetical protein